jgi:hypothetical protein
MTAPIRQRIPLAASDEQVIVRRSAARHDRAMAAAGVLPPKPRHAGCGLIPLRGYQPTIAARGAKTRTGAVKSAIGAALRGATRYERRRRVQPRHAHGLILGAYQRAVILAPSPASGLRRGTLYRESR